jgi:Ca2+-binding RTX toxin-like protein
MRRVILLLALMAATLVVASGVAWAVNKVGTNGPDTLRGTNGDDNLVGLGGNDDLFGLGGSDNLVGGEGKDWVLGGNERRPLGGDKNLDGGPGNDGVLGGNGSDDLVGGSGNDAVDGGRDSDSAAGEEGRDFVDGWRGSDRLSGGDGPDWLVDGPFRETSEDRLSGGDGNDVFFVENGPAARDFVTCGGGFDRVSADTKDVVAPDCEEVDTGPTAGQDLFEQLEELGFFEIFEGLAPAPFPEG